MKIYEIIAQDLALHKHLDETWRERLATMGLVGAMAAGGQAGLELKGAWQTPEPPSASGTVELPAQQASVEPASRPAQALPSKKYNINVSGTQHEQLLRNAAQAAGIQGVELTALLSQAAHETRGFRNLVELGDAKWFRRYDPRHAPKRAANLGNTQAGDGQRYKGRGYIQLTGRYNYRRAGQSLGLNLEAQPELVERPEIAAAVTIWYWQTRVQRRVRDFSDVTAVTKPINPGLRGLDDRQRRFKIYQAAAQ
jgi:predicted chitinase